MIRSGREFSIRLQMCFIPCAVTIYYPPLRVGSTTNSSSERAGKTPPWRGIETVLQSIQWVRFRLYSKKESLHETTIFALFGAIPRLCASLLRGIENRSSHAGN